MPDITDVGPYGDWGYRYRAPQHRVMHSDHISESAMDFNHLEVHMNPVNRPYNPFDRIFEDFITHYSFKPAKSREQVRDEAREKAFGELDVINGDVVKLTYNKGASHSVLEGPVAQVRNVGTVGSGAEHQVRIEGFGETPHGNHNTWFAVRNFDSVEVIERTFRWTTRDRAIVALLGVSDDWWVKIAESTREFYRKQKGARVDAVAAALAG